MKKRFLATFLTLALCLGLCAVPAFAETVSANCVTTTFYDYSDTGFELKEEEQLKSISLTYSIGNQNFNDLGQGIFIEHAWMLRNYYNREVMNYDGYFAVRHNTVFTVTNASPKEEYSHLSVSIQPYVKFPDGTYRDIDDIAALTHNGSFEKYESGIGGEALIGPGDSIQFVLPPLWNYEYNPGYDSSDIIYVLELFKHVFGPPAEEGSSPGPTVNAQIFKSAIIKVDDDVVDSYLANSSTISAAPSFTDVSAGAFYADAVNWAVGQDITNGTGNNKFSPTQDCTHAQILTFLYRAARGGGAAASEDMNKAIDWARGKGMIGANFNSSAKCTRANAVNYIWQAFGKKSAPASSFNDVPAGADYAAAVNWAVANGIAEGTGGGNFSPDKVCNRGTIATLLHRAYVPSVRLK